MKLDGVEGSQYFKLPSENVNGKLEQSALGKPSNSISRSWSFKDTFQRHNNEVQGFSVQFLARTSI